MAARRLRVLVVDDSAVARELIARGIGEDPGIEVVAVAADAYQARDAIEEYEPDVMALDVEMPRMNGIAFLRLLMPQYPMPVVVMSAIGANVFDAMQAGAIDFVNKPEISSREGLQSFLNELVLKLKIASTARVKPHQLPRRTTGRRDGPVSGRINLIAIGASTGGTEAIQELLSGLATDCPPIVIVQHMPPLFTRMYAERLDRVLPFSVREARDGDELRRGQVVIAPGDRHMRLIRSGEMYRVRCEAGDKVSGHCPSVDVLFDSAAKAAGNRAIGVILTGMGADGARGLLQMRTSGARTFGQDAASCVVYGMPMEAWKRGAVERQAPLDRLAELIMDTLGMAQDEEKT